MAAAIHSDGNVAGAISVTATSGQLPEDDFDMVGRAVRDAVDGVTAELGGRHLKAPSDAQPKHGRLVKLNQ